MHSLPDHLNLCLLNRPLVPLILLYLLHRNTHSIHHVQPEVLLEAPCGEAIRDELKDGGVGEDALVQGATEGACRGSQVGAQFEGVEQVDRGRGAQEEPAGEAVRRG
jgi:hypothetical protein